MSTALSKEIQLEVLKLYLNIPKLNYMKLNENMRMFGYCFEKMSLHRIIK